jgi:hypothetical protein
MKIENPNYIAVEEILWIRANGTEVLIQACVGIPYKSGNAWACPAALIGVDDRYVDIVGESSFQSLNLAMRLIRQRLGHLLDAGDVLTYPNDGSERWDADVLDVVFGKV